MSLTIVEGCSGSGKTSWIRENLDDILGFSPVRFDRYFTRGGEPHTPAYRQGVFNALIDISHEIDVVIDRMHWSESYFGESLRDYKFDWQNFEHELLIHCAGGLELYMFYVYAPLDVCLLRVENRGRELWPGRTFADVPFEWRHLELCRRRTKLDVKDIDNG